METLTYVGFFSPENVMPEMPLTVSLSPLSLLEQIISMFQNQFKSFFSEFLNPFYLKEDVESLHLYSQ